MWGIPATLLSPIFRACSAASSALFCPYVLTRRRTSMNSLIPRFSPCRSQKRSSRVFRAAPCLSPFRKGASVPEGSGAFPEKLELVVRIEDPVIVSERSSVNGDPLLSAVDRHPRHEGFAVLQLRTPLHRRHIAAYRRFASRKVVLLHQPAVYPFCRMALVPRVFKVLFQPLVDDLVMGGPSTGKGCVFLGEYLSIPPEGLFHGVFRMSGFPGYFAHVLGVRSLRGLHVFVLINPEDTFPPASSSWCSFTTAKARSGGQFSAVVRSKKVVR